MRDRLTIRMKLKILDLIVAPAFLEKKQMKRIYDFFKSVRLALVLISYIILTSIAASVIPQAREHELYMQMFPGGIASVILFLHFDDFFRSFAFLLPLGLFFLNLLACTIDRIARRFAAHARLRLGPDIIHAGLLVLLVAGVVTFSTRTEEQKILDPGETWITKNGLALTLTRFDFLKYPDGRAQSWIAHVKVEKNNRVLRDDFGIEVNKPLSEGGESIYLLSYKTDARIAFIDAAGEKKEVHSGGMIVGENRLYVVGDTEDRSGKGKALFTAWKKDKTYTIETFGKGESIGDLTIDSITYAYSPKLSAAIDPGIPLVCAAFIVIACGLVLAYAQKLMEEKS
jgi:hypothetical protein